MLAACAGSVYSLATGAQFIQTGKYRRVLCIGADTLSRITDFTDRGTCILLADAAGAVGAEATEDGSGHHRRRPLFATASTGSCSTCPAVAPGIRPRTRRSTQGMHYAKMKGNEVFKVAVRMFADCAERILTRHGFTADDVTLFIPHQANLRIIEAACKRVNLPDGSRVRQRRPLRQHRRRLGLRRPRRSQAAGRLKKGDLVLLAAFGGGFAWGAVLLRW